jgi:hypothetical protein
MPHTLVQTLTKDSNQDGAAGTRTFGTDPVAGHSIIVWGGIAPLGGTGAPLVTDNRGNTYTVLAGPYESTPNALSFLAFCHGIGGSGPLILQVHDSANTNTYQGWTAQEFDGLDVLGYDQTASQGNNTSVTNPSTSATATTTQADEIAFAALCCGAGPDLTSVAVGGSWTQRRERINSSSGSTGPSGEDDSLDLTATGAQSASWTLGTASGYSALIVTFKDSTDNPVSLAATSTLTPAVSLVSINRADFPASSAIATAAEVGGAGVAAMAASSALAATADITDANRVSMESDSSLSLSANQTPVTGACVLAGTSQFSIPPGATAMIISASASMHGGC